MSADVAPTAAEQFEDVAARRVPSKPCLLVATLVGGINVTVSWTEPQDEGESPITRYVIKYGDSNTDVDKFATQSVDGNTTDFQFTYLNEYTSYRFAVAAVNACGQGKFSKFTHDVYTRSIGELFVLLQFCSIKNMLQRISRVYRYYYVNKEDYVL